MNILLTTAGGFQSLETHERVATWRSRAHIIELMRMEDIPRYLRLSLASSLALVDAIVCIADDPPLVGWQPIRTNFFQLNYALQLTADVRDLPESCAMSDGKKWRSIPVVIFASPFDYELSQSLKNSTHATIVFNPHRNGYIGLTQIQRIVDDYKERVLDDYIKLGILVRFVRGHAQIGPALRKRGASRESEYYYPPADRRKHSGWVTAKRDDDALRYDVEYFQELIDRHASETEMHRFFEEHPAFLMEARSGIPISHRPSFVEPERTTPDYSFTPILGPHDSQAAELMELKGPGEQVLSYKFHPGLSAKVHHAIDQVRDYELYLRDPRNRDAVLRAFGYLPEQSSLAVLIGREPTDPEQAEIFERRRAAETVKVITYDDILQTQSSQIGPRLIYDVRSM